MGEKTRVLWTNTPLADAREQAARAFAAEKLPRDFAGAGLTWLDGWQALSGDASPRRYFRCWKGEKSYIVMDSPLPPRHGAYIIWEDFQVSPESVRLFCQRQKDFKPLGRLPSIIACDEKNAFVLMEDFGDQWLWHALQDKKTAHATMSQALQALGRWQLQSTRSAYSSPLNHYDATILRAEVSLFAEHFLPFLGENAARGAEILAPFYESESLFPELDHPDCCVHRDWHSRNLMQLPNGGIGILDFQDALWGHPAYDLISLTRDCYVSYPAHDVAQWENAFYDHFVSWYFTGKADWPWHCDAVALQRHLKVLGIFVRLAGEGKNGYLQYLPRVVNYALAEAARLHGDGHADLSALIGILARALPKVDR